MTKQIFKKMYEAARMYQNSGFLLPEKEVESFGFETNIYPEVVFIHYESKTGNMYTIGMFSDGMITFVAFFGGNIIIRGARK